MPSATAEKNAKAKARQYPPDLLQPIEVSLEQFRRLLKSKEGPPDLIMQQEIAAQRERKLHLLLAYYGMDPKSVDDWKHLVLAVAVDHVHGFAVLDKSPPTRGRPIGSTVIDGLSFAYEIEKIVQNKKVSPPRSYCVIANEKQKQRCQAAGNRRPSRTVPEIRKSPPPNDA